MADCSKPSAHSFHVNMIMTNVKCSHLALFLSWSNAQIIMLFVDSPRNLAFNITTQHTPLPKEPYSSICHIRSVVSALFPLCSYYFVVLISSAFLRASLNKLDFLLGSNRKCNLMCETTQLDSKIFPSVWPEDPPRMTHVALSH